MSLKITGHPKTEAKTEVEQKRKLDWYVPIFYIQSLKLFREASRINFLIISHTHIAQRVGLVPYKMNMTNGWYRILY